MDVWQDHVLSKCAAFIGEEFEYNENEVAISLNKREAYIVMKALEDQQRYLNPLLIVEEGLKEPIKVVPSEMRHA